MKQRQEVPKKLAIAILAIIFFSMLSITMAMGQNAVKYHTKLQKENTFEERLNASESFTIKSLKEDRRSAKKMNRSNSKSNREATKKDRIKQDIIALKSKNQ